MIPVADLKKLAIFRDSPVASLERLSKEMDIKKFNSDEVILKEEEVSQALYMIADGSVRIQKKIDKSGDRFKIVARLEQEEFFGEMSFLENQPLSATVIANAPTTAYVLTRNALNALIKKDGAAAVDHVLTLMSGLSSKLRRTTQELVTVFEIARLMGQDAPLNENMTQIVNQLQMILGDDVSIAFYRWNMFNDEYDVASTCGMSSSTFPNNLDKVNFAESFQQLPVIASPVNHLNDRLGLFIYLSRTPTAFNSGSRQMSETISAVLAPSLATARAREEEASKRRLEKNKQSGGYSW